MATKAKNAERAPDNLPSPLPAKQQPVDYDSDDLAAEADDEVVDRGEVSAPPPPEGTAPKETAADVTASLAELVTPVKKGRPKKSAEEPPGAPKKKKAKKKGLVSASPAIDSGPRYYYDIQNFIVTNGMDLEQFGITPPRAASQVTQTGIRALAPEYPATPASTPQFNLDVKQEEPLRIPRYAYPSGATVSENDTFCTTCGLRLAKHAMKSGSRGGNKCLFYLCPDV